MPSTILKTRIKLVCFYFQIDECRNLFEIPLIIYSGENTWSVTKESVEIPPKYQTIKNLTQGLLFMLGRVIKLPLGQGIQKNGPSNICERQPFL